jgi:hypothetical protein
MRKGRGCVSCWILILAFGLWLLRKDKSGFNCFSVMYLYFRCYRGSWGFFAGITLIMEKISVSILFSCQLYNIAKCYNTRWQRDTQESPRQLSGLAPLDQGDRVVAREDTYSGDRDILDTLPSRRCGCRREDNHFQEIQRSKDAPDHGLSLYEPHNSNLYLHQ